MNLNEEWAALVGTAVLGTDRRPLPEVPPELVAWSSSHDPAVTLLDRAAALATARRAGARPLPPAPPLRPPAPDDRQPCPPAAARVLALILRRGERELLGEWLARAAGRGWRLPAEHAPAVLHRAAGDPQLAAAARDAAGPLATWLASTFEPERPAAAADRGARSVLPSSTAAAPAGTEDGEPVPTPVPAGDPGDAVEAVVELFTTGGAGAHRAALRATVLAVAPADLPRLAGALDGITGQPLTAPLRRELADLARVRADLVAAFTATESAGGG